MTENSESWPFSIPPGDRLGGLFKNTENVIRTLGDEWIVKTPSWRTKIAGRNKVEYVKEMKGDYDLLKQYIPDFVVETHFVFGEEDGKPSYFVLQKRLHGQVRSLHEISDKEIAEPEIAQQLQKFISGVLQMEEKTGKMPDLFGRPINPLNPKFYNPRYSDNILLVKENDGTERLYITDIGEISAQARNRLPHVKIFRGKVLENLKAFKVRIDELLRK